MKTLRLLLGGAAIGIIVMAFRDQERGSWLAPAGRRGGVEENEEAEPVLGYDGMDVDTLLDWLESADLDRATLARMREYETAHLAREAILDALGPPP